VSGDALGRRVASAWEAAFGHAPRDLVVVGDAVHVEGLALYPLRADGWGVGTLCDIAPEAPGEPVGVGVTPRSEHATVEGAIFALLEAANPAEEARRAMEGKRPRWEELFYGD
jgi:hypothetical protein